MKTYAGLDLHGDNVYCGISDENDKRVFAKRLPCDIDVIAEALKPYRDTLQGVVVESTFNWYWLVDALIDLEFRVHLANPGGMEQYQGLKNGDDRTDSFFLAKMLRLGILPEGYIYPKDERGLRDLCRRRLRTVQQRTALILSMEGLIARETGRDLNGNDIRGLTVEDLDNMLSDAHVREAARALHEHIEFLDTQIKRLESVILKEMRPNERYQRLLTIDGIGKVLAMTIVLETGELARFKGAGNYASYCRTVSSERTSNDKKKGEGNRKNGNRYLAWAFVEAANQMARYCPEARSYVQRKTAKRQLRVVAIKSLAAKLAKACYFMMRDGVDFEVKKMFG